MMATSRPSRPEDKTTTPARPANREILINTVAEHLETSNRAAARVVAVVLDSIEELLHSRGRVVVRGFGAFDRRIRKGRAYVHPVTGDVIEVPERETIAFKAAERLLTSIRESARVARDEAAASDSDSVDELPDRDSESAGSGPSSAPGS